MRCVTGGRSSASVFEGLASLSDAFADGSGSGLRAMLDRAPGRFRAMLDRLPGFLRRALIVLSKAKRER